MLSVPEAQRQIMEAAKVLPPESVPLLSAAGRILRSTITAPLNFPRFTNSAMDGYAVKAKDLEKASGGQRVSLRKQTRIAAGSAPGKPLEDGCCARVFTGSAIPVCADAVVMQEDVEAAGELVHFKEAVTVGENLRFEGEDIRRDTVIATEGARLGFSTVSVLSACGFSEVTVGRQPRVGLLATGNELKEAGEELGAADIYESNRAALSLLVQNVECIPKIYGLVPDTLGDTVSCLKRALSENDVVVSTGGVSVGDMDFVKEAFRELGGALVFWRLSMRPGKPFVLGQFEDKIFCGLPGNPVSAAVTFFILVRPLLLKMQGASNCEPRKIAGELLAPIQNGGDRLHYVRVGIDNEGRVAPVGRQASHMLSSLLQSDGLVAVPAGGSLQRGQKVEVLLWA